MKSRIILSILLFFSVRAAFSQMYNGEAFLKGKFVEVGISSCGSFGSSNVFSGSHSRTNNGYGVGFVADPDKDGWDVGSPNYYGDFFLPGSPVEGWGVQVFRSGRNNLYENGNNGGICSPSSISGSLTNYNSNGNILSATWSSDSNFSTASGVSVCQTAYLSTGETFFTVTVKLCNTTSQTIDSVYYVRSVDPDNDEMLAPAGYYGYTTDNKIQPRNGTNRYVVSANGRLYPQAFLALGADNPNARVAIRTGGNIFLPNSITEVWDGSGGSYNTTNSIDDVNIALAFKFKNIAPGACVEFTYAYVLNLADLDKAIAATSDNFNIIANGTDITQAGSVTVPANTLLSMSIVGNPGYSWVWTPTDNSGTLTGNSQLLSLTANRTYNLTGTYSTGCTTKTKNLSINVIIGDPCTDCVPSFSPIPGQKYLLSAWVKEEMASDTIATPDTYTNSGIRITFTGANSLPIMRPSGPVIDGWQRIEASFTVPAAATAIQVHLLNDHANGNVYFDDVRIHPFTSNMKSFVYDPSTQKLTAELDENNYATKYEYDDEGILIRVKKETERGVMTIKETRNNQSKIKP